MERRAIAPFFLIVPLTLAAVVLRFWALSAALDADGLPAMHPAIYIWIAVTVVFLLGALLISSRSPGRSGSYRTLQYGSADFPVSVSAAALILLGVVIEFAETLVSRPTPGSVIMVLSGILGGICLFVAVWQRRTLRPGPGAEIFPVVYLLLKLIVNFKSWSTDPIILDYCFVLFALIFALLAFFLGAGFVFDRGKSRRTLFAAMAAVYFCAVAVAGGIYTRSLSTIVGYLGFLLWQIPVIRLLFIPSPPEQKQEQ